MDAHSYDPRIHRALDEAEAICAHRGTRLTSLRRRVLGLVLETDGAASAYGLLDRLRAEHKGAAPPTVYRALDFLLEHGLVHKVERLSAYVGCVHAHAHEGEHHAAQFLICRQCGRVAELEDEAIRAALGRAAALVGFRAQGSTVEIEGICAACAEPASAGAPAGAPVGALTKTASER